jgi:hypothetical protein
MSDDLITLLRAENESLRLANKLLVTGIDTITRSKNEEIERLRAENEKLRDVLRRVSVHPSGDRMVKITFVSEDCMVTYPVRPQTTWALEVMIEFDKARRNALEDKP